MNKIKTYLNIGFLITFLISIIALSSGPVFAQGRGGPAVSPEQAASIASRGENNLELMAKVCHDMKRNDDTWNKCLGYQKNLKDYLGCSDSMFYQKQDPEDSTAKLDEWFTNKEKFAECYNKASAKIAVVAGDKCKSMRHGNGVDDSPAWKDCEKEQDRLHDALGCSDKMFKQGSSKTIYTQDESKINNCKERVERVGALKLIGANGVDSNTVKENSTTAPGGENSTDKEDNAVSCDNYGGSPLGWILCPVIELGTSFNNFVFNDLVVPLMDTVPVNLDADNGAYKAWQGFRIIANAMLVIAMLAIVYYQAKGGE